MLRRTEFLWRRFRYELGTLTALAKYAVNKNELVARLERSMPSITIETTNICNADCIFCAYQYQERPIGVMSDQLFRKVVNEFVECGGGGISMTPTVGDPLVDPDIVERIRWAASRPNISGVGITTNMISLGRFGAEALVHSGLAGLAVSMSGFDENMYLRVYRSKTYRKVIENIKAFARANNEAGRPVDLHISCRIDRSIREATATSDYREISELVGPNKIDFKFRYDNWAGKITQDQLSGNMKLRGWVATLRRPRISPCGEMFSGPIVYWDGKVGACGCRDVNASELIIGDATKDHLAAIWFGAEIAKLREEFLTSRVRDICRQCSHYGNLSNFFHPAHCGVLENIKPAAEVPRKDIREPVIAPTQS